VETEQPAMQAMDKDGEAIKRMAGKVLRLYVSAACLLSAHHAVLGGGDGFPFSIAGDRFERDGKTVFLNTIGYSPYEPGQSVHDTVRAERVKDDLRRWRLFTLGDDPVAIRVYPHRMPGEFYEGVRDLGLWIVRTIYFEEDYWAQDAIARARERVDDVVSEVCTNNALDLVFSWQIGNELGDLQHAQDLDDFLETVVDIIRDAVASRATNVSTWVTWNCPWWWDPILTRPDGGSPIPSAVTNFDFYSFNAYPYEPDRIRDHQGGIATGTPYAGYLAALNEYLQKPVVVSETGLPDSTVADPHHAKYQPWYPCYRKGGLSGEQVAEGLADRYWDARLVGVAGYGIFEWNDEWWKGEGGSPDTHEEDMPEESFGLLRFVVTNGVTNVCAKFQHDTIRALYSLQFREGGGIITGVTSSAWSVPSGGCATMAVHCAGDFEPVAFRWEASRGHVVGDSADVLFYAATNWLGDAEITVLAMDRLGHVGTTQRVVTITPPVSEPCLEALTLGVGNRTSARASGRVLNADMSTHKVVCYIKTNKLYVQPDINMTRTWVRSDGYWWLPVNNEFAGELHAWLVPRDFVATNRFTPPPASLAHACLVVANDEDNDRLPDQWEIQRTGDTGYGWHDDPDSNGAGFGEEFLNDTNCSASVGNNDRDGDGLPDNWERLFFGGVHYLAGDDPDGDGLTNSNEWRLGLHPGRTTKDRDRDSLPDTWEWEMFGSLRKATNSAFSRNMTVLDAYEGGVGTFPTSVSVRAMDVTNGKVTLDWQSSSGFVYRVFQRDSLTAGLWKGVDWGVSASGTSVSKDVPTGGSDVKFYRVGVCLP